MVTRLTSWLIGFFCLICSTPWSYSQIDDVPTRDSLKLSPDVQAIVEANPESYPENYRFLSSPIKLIP